MRKASFTPYASRSKGARMASLFLITSKKADGYLPTRVARMPRSPRTAVEGSAVTPPVSGNNCSDSMLQSLAAVGPPYLLRISMKFSAPMESS